VALLSALMSAAAPAAAVSAPHPASPSPDTVATAPRDSAAAVRVALVAGRSSVVVGDTLEVSLHVTASGPGFNGYDAVVEFDPQVLEYLPTTPQRALEGDAMTGACGNTFHRVRADADSVVIAHVVLCAGVSLPGPGTLHHLRFRTLAPGAPGLRLRRTQFYSAGRYLPPALVDVTSLTIERRPPPRPSR
jgi:hypothetical protein